LSGRLKFRLAWRQYFKRGEATKISAALFTLETINEALSNYGLRLLTELRVVQVLRE
jgi:hypothetical protein